VVTAVVAGCAFAAPARGCSCPPPLPPGEEARLADVVATVTVERIREDPLLRFANWLRSLFARDGLYLPTVGVEARVEERLKGRPPSRIRLVTSLEESSCGYPFREGRQYLVYSYRTEDGELSADRCSRTKPLEEAEAEVEELRALLR
jgi:hypothetical protein